MSEVPTENTAAQPTPPQPAPQKKKASWLRTILWMLSMIMLVNLAMVIVAYFMFFYNK
jgi:flagellar basal body-associated protein FliL